MQRREPARRRATEPYGQVLESSGGGGIGGSLAPPEREDGASAGGVGGLLYWRRAAMMAGPYCARDTRGREGSKREKP